MFFFARIEIEVVSPQVFPLQKMLGHFQQRLRTAPHMGQRLQAHHQSHMGQRLNHTLAAGHHSMMRTTRKRAADKIEK